MDGKSDDGCWSRMEEAGEKKHLQDLAHKDCISRMFSAQDIGGRAHPVPLSFEEGLEELSHVRVGFGFGEAGGKEGEVGVRLESGVSGEVWIGWDDAMEGMEGTCHCGDYWELRGRVIGVIQA